MASNKTPKVFLKQLNKTLSKAREAERFKEQMNEVLDEYIHNDLSSVAGIAHLGDQQINPFTMEAMTKALIDIVAPADGIHTLYRTVEYDNLSITSKAVFFFADVERAKKNKESIKYALGSLRVNSDPTGVRVFKGYIPFKITRHSIIRLLERSASIKPAHDIGEVALVSYSTGIADVFEFLPAMVVASLVSKHHFFGVPIADGILLCELMEDDDTYEATEKYISPLGTNTYECNSIFGNPSKNKSRMILGKTWIGPEEVKENQAAQIERLSEVLSTHSNALESFRDADVFRQPNWIDKHLPSYQEPDLTSFIEASTELANLYNSTSFQSAFRPPRPRY